MDGLWVVRLVPTSEVFTHPAAARAAQGDGGLSVAQRVNRGSEYGTDSHHDHQPGRCGSTIGSVVQDPEEEHRRPEDPGTAKRYDRSSPQTVIACLGLHRIILASFIDVSLRSCSPTHCDPVRLIVEGGVVIRQDLMTTSRKGRRVRAAVARCRADGLGTQPPDRNAEPRPNPECKADPVANVERDLTWDAIVTVAERLNARAVAQGLAVASARRRSWRQVEVVEGLHCGDRWTDVFEPVRSRRMLGARWQEIQPVPEAASKIGTFMRERPDLGKTGRTAAG